MAYKYSYTIKSDGTGLIIRRPYGKGISDVKYYNEVYVPRGQSKRFEKTFNSNVRYYGKSKSGSAVFKPTKEDIQYYNAFAKRR